MRRLRLVFGFIVAFALLLILEGALRILVHEAGQASIPSDIVAAHVAQGAMKYDPELGWIWAQVPVPALGINAEGLRYGPVSTDKPAGTIRGFTLGDSQTFGAGLEADASYTAVAEAAVRARGVSMQLIGAGVAGHGSLQALRRIETQLLAYDPDFVVIDCRTFDAPRETREPRGHGATEPLRRLLFESRIYYVLRLGLRELGWEQGRRMKPQPQDNALGAGNHDLIAELGEREGFKVIFVDYPVMVDGSILSRAPATELPEGATVVPATAALQATGVAAADLFFDTNHLKPQGAAVVGEALATTLLALYGP